MSEWKECKLGELIADKSADLQTGPFGTMLNATEYTIEGTPVIAVQDIGENKLVYHKFVFVNDSTAQRLSRYRVKENDIIFGRKGAVERRALIKKKEEGWLQGSDCIRLRFSDKVEPKFASYQFGTKYYQEWMFQNAGGATMPSLNQNVLKELPIRFPDITKQRTIASVLSSLDDKMDLLHRQNTTLEAMAETLFRQWFVVEAMENWPVDKLGNHVVVKRGGSPRPIQDYMSDKGLRWLKISDATKENSPYIFEIKEHIKIEGLSKTTHLKAGTLVLSNSATPGIPKILHVDTCIHDGWLHFPESIFSNEFLYLFFKSIRPELLQLGNGSIFTNLKTDILKEFELPIPDSKSLSEFDNLIKPTLNKLYSNTVQIRTLTALRDTLLPKLMSGEVMVEM
jgi:type I restriction enzyme S subunit